MPQPSLIRSGLLGSALILVVFGFGLASEKNETSVETMPPVVVHTVPKAGDAEVDPALKEIRVTFSKEMMTNEMWSWVRASQDTFPEISGDVRYLEDKRTCVLPVKLRPGQTYACWINSGEHRSFQDLGKRPAVPYLLVFETRRARGDGADNKEHNLAVDKTLKSLLSAIETGDREAFLVNATDQVKQGMTQPLMDVLKTQLGARLTKGYQVNYLCQLNQAGHQVHLWKSTFTDAGDDVVYRLALKEGKVAGFFLQ